jgi:hypothetical protein
MSELPIKNWSVLIHDKRISNIPNNDTLHHDIYDCICCPRIEEINEYKVVIHNSFDGREVAENADNATEETVEEPEIDMARSYMYGFLIGVCVIEALFVSVYWSDVTITMVRFLMVQVAIMYAVILIDNHQIKTENENI